MTMSKVRYSAAGARQEASDIIVAGGGLVGLTLGLAVASAGLQALVVDQSPLEARLADHYDGRASAISFAAWRMLTVLGVTQRIEAAEPIKGILVTDGRPGTHVVPGDVNGLSLHFDAKEANHGEPLGWMVENRHIRKALAEVAATMPGLTIQAPDTMVDYQITPQKVTVALSSGQQAAAQVLIGADGRGSRVRQQAGIRTYGWDYDQTGIVTTVQMEQPHRGIAHELFLPTGPLAILPLTGNRANIVWSEEKRRASALLAMTPEAFSQELSRRFGDFLGDVKLTTPVFSYPLSLQLAADWVKPRMALVGDAAHGIHPVAGQGLNLGLKDVAALAEVLVEADRVGLDLGDTITLERYARWRRADTMTLAVSCDAFVRLFSTDAAPVRLLRTLGLGLVDASGPLRQLFARHAGGAVGDLPRLLQGHPLSGQLNEAVVA